LASKLKKAIVAKNTAIRIALFICTSMCVGISVARDTLHVKYRNQFQFLAIVDILDHLIQQDTMSRQSHVTIDATDTCGFTCFSLLYKPHKKCHNVLQMVGNESVLIVCDRFHAYYRFRVVISVALVR
jgi:hypothetical protein